MNSNVNFAVQLHNGSVGVPPIFASLVIRSSAKDNDLIKRRKKIYHNAKGRNTVRWGLNIRLEMNFRLGVLCVGILRRMLETFDEK